MCGIFCFLSPGREIDEFFLRKLSGGLSLLKHRGPDDEGVYLSPDRKIFLGHRRLGILDLSSYGHQPMTSRDGRFTIVFNGEIYNFRELKEKLRRHFNFISSSDTEVLLNSYIWWGDEVFNHLDGMYVFLIWDNLKKELIVGRDLLGQKPLYYFLDKRGIFFSSEIKVLLKFKGDISISKSGFFFYLLYGSVAGENSIFKGIKKFPPASYLKICPSNFDGNFKIRSFFKNSIFREDIDLEYLIEESVRKRLVADVKVGVMLSGGIDSSLITSTAKKFKDEIDSYTVVFSKGNSLFDESSRVHYVVDSLGIKNKVIEIEEEDFKKKTFDLIKHIEEPVSNPVWTAIFLISKFAREDGTKVLLSGDGGDEIFFGYNRWIRYLWAIKFFEKFKFFPVGEINREFYFRERVKIPFFSGKSNFKLFQLRDMVDGFSELFNEFRDFLDGERALFKTIFPEGRLDQWISFISIRTNFIEDFLMRNDKMGMANSLEIRSPLLNKDIFFSGINLKRRNRFFLKKGKVFLRNLISRHLGRDFSGLKKIGFCAPISMWRECYVDKSWIEELFSIDRENGFFREGFLKNFKKDIYGLDPFKVYSLYFFVKWYGKWLRR